MPSHHSSHHSSSHHSSTQHTSTTHHTTPIGVPPPIPPVYPYRRRFFYGGPGGMGCGIVSAIIGVVVVIVIVGIALVASNSANSQTPSVGFDSGSSSVADNPTDIPLQQDPTVIADLAVMNGALLKFLPTWMAQQDTIVHHVSVADAGLPSNFNTKEVVYGHCSPTQFYMFVLNITPPDDTTADTEGYEYTPGSTPSTCAPTGWQIMTSEFAAADWYFITADTSKATQASPAQ